nr:UDP-N-acetylmuramate dehydrogenase [Mesorhizobium sp. BR1-1-16]
MTKDKTVNWIDALEETFPGVISRDVSLATISRWRIGGNADAVARPHDLDELARMRRYLHENGVPHVVIGATTNLLFADEGLRVLALQIGREFARIDLRDNEMVCGAGAWVPGVARQAMLAGLTGIEHTCGIPGTVGGLVCMNGGSQRRGIGEAIVEVVSVDERGRLIRRSREECGFAYRRSIFQTNGEIVAETTLTLDRSRPKGDIRRAMIGILSDRRRKFPQKLPNCGSVFVSNPAMYAEVGPPGAVIERLGFKGRKIGGAQVSPQHANFIVNNGSARAQDVQTLIGEIKAAVLAATGYDMEVEARFVRPDGILLPADRIQ